MKIISYTRVSTEDQAKNGAGLEAQAAALQAEADRRNWQVVPIVDNASGKNLRRPGIERALAMLKAGEADGLMVAKLDRLSRSLFDFCDLMRRAHRERWALVALDLGVDTSTPSGEMMANVLASFAQFERRIIGQRTADALAVRRQQGIRLGRPPVLSAELRRRIRRARKAGRSYRQIADRLNRARVPTAHGGARWHASTVRAVERQP